MNPTSITLTALALAGALSSAYFWHQTGNQKAEQARLITELRSENKALVSDGDSLRHQLANAEARSAALADTLKKDGEQRLLLSTQLADSRREMEGLRQEMEKTLALADKTAAESRSLKEEMESLNRQLATSARPEQLAALGKQLAQSQEHARILEERIRQLTKPAEVAVTQPSPEAGNKAKVSSNKSRLIPASVRQVKGDKVLLGYGSRQGAAVNSDVRLQDGLDYLGFGRVIYVDDSQCLVELNRGHENIPADKEILVLTPEASESVAIPE